VRKDGGGNDAITSCGGAAVLPPIVNVTRASDGSQICGATIRAVTDAGAAEGANLASACSASLGGCPTSAPAGGSLSCVYAVEGADGTQTVSVSAPGFSPKTVSVTSGLAGCSGGSAASTVTISLDPAEGPTGDASNCGAIELIPPTVTARDARTGAVICDLVITIVADGGATSPDAGNAGYPCASDLGGCPSSAPDGGSLSCVYLVSVGGVFGGPQTILVSAPGYEPKLVPDVQSGSGGCVSNPSAGTQVHVSLEPLSSDAGADAKGD
jgi:hypothetical protein